MTLDITVGHCYNTQKLHYRQPVDKNDYSKYMKLGVDSYCLLDATKCPFYQLIKKESFCKVKNYDVK